jgi:CyaY protein
MGRSIPSTYRIAYVAALVGSHIGRPLRQPLARRGGGLLSSSASSAALSRRTKPHRGKRFMSLSEARFHDLVDAAQEEIEDVFDHSGMDVDLDNSGGVLTVRFENGTQLIFSRQPPLRQLWVAARSGGFHFDYDEAASLWICDTNDERLGELLARVTQEQGGEALEFEDL